MDGNSIIGKTAASQQTRVDAIQIRARRRQLGAALDLYPKTHITSSVLEDHLTREQLPTSRGGGARTSPLSRTDPEVFVGISTAAEVAPARTETRGASRGASRGGTTFSTLKADISIAHSPLERARAAFRLRIFRARAAADELLKAKNCVGGPKAASGGLRGARDISFFAALHLSGPVALAAEMVHLDGDRAVTALCEIGAGNGDPAAVAAKGEMAAKSAVFAAQVDNAMLNAPETALEGAAALDAVLPSAIRLTAIRLAPVRIGKVSLARAIASPIAAALVRCVVWLAVVRLISEREMAHQRRFEARCSADGLSIGEATEQFLFSQHVEALQADLHGDEMDSIAVGEVAALAQFAINSAQAAALPLDLPLVRRAFAAAEVSSLESIEHTAALDAAIIPSSTTLAATNEIVAAAARVYAALLRAMHLDAAEQVRHSAGAPLRRRDRLRREAFEASVRAAGEKTVRHSEDLDAFPSPSDAQSSRMPTSSMTMPMPVFEQDANVFDEAKLLARNGQSIFRPFPSASEDPVLNSLSVLPWAITDAAFHCLVAMLPASELSLNARFKLDLFVLAGRLLTGVDIDPIVALNAQLTVFSPLLLVINASAPDLPITLTYEDIPAADAIDAFGAAGVLSSTPRLVKIGRSAPPPRVFRFIRIGDPPLLPPTLVELAIAEEAQARRAGLRTSTELYKTLAPRERATLGLRDATRVELLRGVEAAAAIPLGAFLAAGSTVPAALLSSTADVSALLPRPRPKGSPIFEANLSFVDESMRFTLSHRRAVASVKFDELLASGSGSPATLASAFAESAGICLSKALTASFASLHTERAQQGQSPSTDVSLIAAIGTAATGGGSPSPDVRLRTLEALALTAAASPRRNLAPPQAASNFRSFIVHGPVTSRQPVPVAAVVSSMENSNAHDFHPGDTGGGEDVGGVYPTNTDSSWPCTDIAPHASSSIPASSVMLSSTRRLPTPEKRLVDKTVDEVLSELSGQADVLAGLTLRTSPRTISTLRTTQRTITVSPTLGPRFAAVLSNIFPPPAAAPAHTLLSPLHIASPGGGTKSNSSVFLVTTVARAAALTSLSPIDATRALINTTIRPSALRVPFLADVPSSLLAYALGVDDARAQVVLGAGGSPNIRVAAAVAARRRGPAFVASALRRTVTASWAAAGGLSSFYAAHAGGEMSGLSAAVAHSQEKILADAHATALRDARSALLVQQELAAKKAALAGNMSRESVLSLSAEVTKERLARKEARVTLQKERFHLRVTYGSAALAPRLITAAAAKRNETLNLYSLAQTVIASGFYKGNLDDFAAPHHRKDEDGGAVNRNDEEEEEIAPRLDLHC